MPETCGKCGVETIRHDWRGGGIVTHEVVNGVRGMVHTAESCLARQLAQRDARVKELEGMLSECVTKRIDCDEGLLEMCEICVRSIHSLGGRFERICCPDCRGYRARVLLAGKGE